MEELNIMHETAHATALRPPGQVMRLNRMGSFFQTRLSFMRTLVRRMHREAWRFEDVLDTLDANGYGRAVTMVHTPAGSFSFVAFSHHLDPEYRTDRVIAEQWDATFALVEGPVDAADLDRLEAMVPRQEAGHYSARDLVLSRANKSVRLFDHVTGELAAGRQPSLAEIAKVGYLMRTTAVYGNGKFGMGDFAKLAGKGVLDAPFQAELLTVYMIRDFSHALAEHVARARNSKAAALSPDCRRGLGIGNATGLGMAPFLVKHPILIHRWMHARETALARARAVETADGAVRARFAHLLDRAIAHVHEWTVDDARQRGRIETLRSELAALRAEVDRHPATIVPAVRPWDALYRHVEATMSLEAQELCVSLVLELHPGLVDPLEREMASDRIEKTEPAMPLAALLDHLETEYRWALDTDFDTPQAQHHFWYYSAGKEEPRRGKRFEEPGAELEMRIGFGREIFALHRALSALPPDALRQPTAAYLLGAPWWRAAVRRIQTLMHFPYGEIRDNLLAADCLPIDMLRCKLSFFGATKFDPKSDLWTRITLYQGAPLRDELGRDDADDWAFPTVLGGRG